MTDHERAQAALDTLAYMLEHGHSVELLDALLESADRALDAVTADDETRWAYMRLAERAESIRLELARA
jgi:hypothetical protein